MGFLNIVRKIYPAISVFSGLGGPFGVMAAGAVGKALGVDKVDPDKITDVVTAAMGDPTKAAALLQAEQDLQLQKEKLGFESIEEMESLAVQDRDSARQREVAVRDYTPEVGFYALIGVFVYFIHYLFKYPVPADNKAIVYSAAGTLGSLVVSAATYFYGTTRGAQNQSAAIQTIASTAATTKK